MVDQPGTSKPGKTKPNKTKSNAKVKSVVLEQGETPATASSGSGQDSHRSQEGSAPSTPPPSEMNVSPSASFDAFDDPSETAVSPARRVPAPPSAISPAEMPPAGCSDGLPAWQYLVFLWGNRFLGLIVAVVSLLLSTGSKFGFWPAASSVGASAE